MSASQIALNTHSAAVLNYALAATTHSCVHTHDEVPLAAIQSHNKLCLLDKPHIIWVVIQ